MGDTREVSSREVRMHPLQVLRTAANLNLLVYPRNFDAPEINVVFGFNQKISTENTPKGTKKLIMDQL